MTHAGLFSGIGGFSLAAKWMDWVNVFDVEIDAWCRKVLHKNFPTTQLFEDVCAFDGLPFRGRIDVLSGGFPCQPWSSAGQRKGTEDPRHLWPQFLRVIREVRPRFVVGENVRGLLSWGGGLQFEAVCAELEAEGYDVLPFLLPAAGVGAIHKRDRFWFVAHANGGGFGTQQPDLRGRECNPARQPIADPNSGDSEWQQDAAQQAGRAGFASILCHAADAYRARQPQPGGPLSDLGRRAEHGGKENAAGRADSHAHGPGLAVGQGQPSDHEPQQPAAFGADGWFTEPALCTPDDGLPVRLLRPGKYHIPERRDRARILKAAGNAIVPQVALQIFQAIEATALPSPTPTR